MTSSGGETREDPSGWTTDTLRMYVQTQLDQLNVLLDARFKSQQEAMGTAFTAQQRAMVTAFSAADAAVHAALASAEKAVIKAEIASDKRFESVNEFRAQLADQAATFMPRTEAESSMARNTERIQEIQTHLTELMPRLEYGSAHESLVKQVQDITDRLNRAEGSTTGVISNRAQLMALVSVVASVIAVIITIYVVIKGA